MIWIPKNKHGLLHNFSGHRRQQIRHKFGRPGQLLSQSVYKRTSRSPTLQNNKKTQLGIVYDGTSTLMNNCTNPYTLSKMEETHYPADPANLVLYPRQRQSWTHRPVDCPVAQNQPTRFYKPVITSYCRRPLHMHTIFKQPCISKARDLGPTTPHECSLGE